MRNVLGHMAPDMFLPRPGGGGNDDEMTRILLTEVRQNAADDGHLPHGRAVQPDRLAGIKDIRFAQREPFTELKKIK